MKITCLKSGSKGNCFLISQNNECVVLECGLQYKCIANAIISLGTPLKCVLGVLCTHCHKDHSLALNDFINYGYKVYCPKSCNFEGYNVTPIEENKLYKIGSWLEVMPFKTLHDTESYGYFLRDTITDELILFMTDTSYFEFPFSFMEMDKIYIECNHIRKALDKRYEETNDFKYFRQGAYHLSLAGCKKMSRNMKLDKCKEINLIHFSEELGYPELCKKDIEKEFKIKTNIC